MTVFVDSSALISLWDKDDLNHLAAIEKSQELQKIKATIFISNIVAGEVLTVLSMKLGIKLANQCGEMLQKLNIIFVDESLHQKAWVEFKKRTSKNLSFFDFTSLAAVRAFDMDKVFTFDGDFKKLGIKTV